MKAILLGLIPFAIAESYGPNNCVSITRSQQGSCVITTNCGEGDDLGKLEFAFDCQNAASLQKHSFGVGGFDQQEEFDTNIKCSQCHVPEKLQHRKPHKPHKVLQKKKAHEVVKKKADIHIPSAGHHSAAHTPHHSWHENVHALHAAQSKTEAKQSKFDDDLVDKYGPGDCVETWRGTTGTCTVRTRCKDQDVSNYDFGMLCVQNTSSGENVKHLFGKGSFDKEEEFDTLIKCEQCLGLKADPAPADPAPAATPAANADPEKLVEKVNNLVAEVGTMTTDMGKLKDEVKSLNEKVPKLYGGGEEKKEEKKEEKPEEKKEEKKEEKPAEEEKKEEKPAELFLSHKRSESKVNAKHRHKKHHAAAHVIKKERHVSDDDDDRSADEDDKVDEGRKKHHAAIQKERRSSDDDDDDRSTDEDDKVDEGRKKHHAAIQKERRSSDDDEQSADEDDKVDDEGSDDSGDKTDKDAEDEQDDDRKGRDQDDDKQGDADGQDADEAN